MYPELYDMSTPDYTMPDVVDPDMMYAMEDFDYMYEPMIAESGMWQDDMNMENFDMDSMVDWQQQDMRAEFRDYFGYAIMGDMWDNSKPSECNEGCDAEFEMCCVHVAMQDMDTQVTNHEYYCMAQEAAMDDFTMSMSAYDT